MAGAAVADTRSTWLAPLVWRRRWRALLCCRERPVFQPEHEAAPMRTIHVDGLRQQHEDVAYIAHIRLIQKATLVSAALGEHRIRAVKAPVAGVREVAPHIPGLRLRIFAHMRRRISLTLRHHDGKIATRNARRHFIVERLKYLAERIGIAG